MDNQTSLKDYWKLLNNLAPDKAKEHNQRIDKGFVTFQTTFLWPFTRVTLSRLLDKVHDQRNKRFSVNKIKKSHFWWVTTSKDTKVSFFLWNLFSFLISLTQKLQNTTTQKLKLSQLP